MKCRYCGADLQPHLTICPNCGMPIEGGNLNRRRYIMRLVFGLIVAAALILCVCFVWRLPLPPAPVPTESPSEQEAIIIPYTAPDPTAPASLPSTDPTPAPTVRPASSSSYMAPSQTPQPVLPTPTVRPVLPTPTVRPVLPTPTPQPSYYILPDSNSRYLTEADLQNLSWRELSLARNEIYARHGRRFTKDAIQQYFDSQTWYSGTVAPEDFQTGSLSRIENANIKLIKDYEARLYGGTYF